MSWTILDQNDDGSISLHKEEEIYFVVLTNGSQTLCIESKNNMTFRKGK